MGTKIEMQRQIKFKGLRLDGGGWVCGDLIQYSQTEYKILEPFNRDWDVQEAAYDVIPETVGQFTGLKDKNGVDIYEGDVLERKYNKNGKTKSIREVIWWCEGGYFAFGNNGVFEVGVNEYEIIGNIHENEELLN